MRPLRNCLSYALVYAALASTPLLAQQVNIDYDHSAPFHDFHTYSWGQVKTSDPLFVDRIKQEVDRDLQAKGWQKTPSGADVVIVAVGATQNQQEYNTFYDGLGGWGWRRAWGGGGFGNSYTTVQQIPVGTLVLDMYTPQDHKLLWRGTATDTLSNKPEKNTGKLDKAIDKMLDKFPPK